MTNAEHNAVVSAPLGREDQIARLRDETFDLAIIGGGITGPAIARDAALRGLIVALIDRDDFARATSSHSSKLIHGGLRYLPQGQLRLVYHALRERERLRRLTAPHLVAPIRFLFPFRAGRHPGRIAVIAGLMLYDLFAWTPSDERHQRLSSGVVRELEPALAGDSLRGGALYYDGWGDDARLTIENVADAAIHGAAVANYAEVEGLVQTGSRLSALAVRDIETGDHFAVRARSFINATGPWLDQIRMMDDPAVRPSVRLTKGVHLVINGERLPVKNSLVLTDEAGRIVFVMPRDGWILIGTTDTDFDGDPAKVAADAADIEYLLGIVNDALPQARLAARDVAYSFAGLRVLAGNKGGRRPSAVSREEVIVESASGLLSVGGGKLTTHRMIAGTIVYRIISSHGRPYRPSPTRILPLPGARWLAGRIASDGSGQSNGAWPWLAGRYGSRAAIIASITRERSELAENLAPGAPAIGAEVIFAIRYECARTVSDFLMRRTAMLWRNPPAAIASAEAAARIMAAEPGWDRATKEAQVKAFTERAEGGAVSGALRSSEEGRA